MHPFPRPDTSTASVIPDLLTLGDVVDNGDHSDEDDVIPLVLG